MLCFNFWTAAGNGIASSAPAAKKRTQCSNCKLFGHNKRRCLSLRNLQTHDARPVIQRQRAGVRNPPITPNGEILPISHPNRAGNGATSSDIDENEVNDDPDAALDEVLIENGEIDVVAGGVGDAFADENWISVPIGAASTIRTRNKIVTSSPLPTRDATIIEGP